MDLRASALALPACATAALAVTNGPGILHGEGAWSFAVLAATGAAALVALALAGRLTARGQSAPLPGHIGTILDGTTTAFGDAAFAFDAAGRLVWANETAAALVGESPEELAGRSCAVLGHDIEVLLRGLERGPAAGRVALRGRAGHVLLDGAAVRAGGRPPFDVLVLRLPPEIAAAPREVDESDLVVEPPPLPRRPGTAADRPGRTRTAPVAPVLGPELAKPLGRAAAAAALLRMVMPAGNPAAAQHLAAIEEELRAAETAVTALTAPLAPAIPEAIDVEVMLSDALARAGLDARVHVVRAGEEAWAEADASQLRQALRHALQLAAGSMPSGGVLSLRTAQRGGEVVIEIADSGAGLDAACASLDLPLARRLIAAQRGTLQRVRIPGRGSLCRIVLPGRTPPARRARDTAVPPRPASAPPRAAAPR